MLKLEFPGQSVNHPVLSEVSRLFALDNSIIYAQVEYAGVVKFGAMVVEVIGNPERLNDAIQYYQEKHIKVEVLGYV